MSLNFFICKIEIIMPNSQLLTWLHLIIILHIIYDICTSFIYMYGLVWAFQVVQFKESACQCKWVQSLGWEDPLEK